MLLPARAIVKLAAARTNTDVGAMKKEKPALIEKACQAVRDGKYHDHVIPELVNLVASDELNPQKARVLLSLALLKTRTPQEIQRLFYEY